MGVAAIVGFLVLSPGVASAQEPAGDYYSRTFSYSVLFSYYNQAEIDTTHGQPAYGYTYDVSESGALPNDWYEGLATIKNYNTGAICSTSVGIRASAMEA